MIEDDSVVNFASSENLNFLGFPEDMCDSWWVKYNKDGKDRYNLVKIESEEFIEKVLIPGSIIIPAPTFKSVFLWLGIWDSVKFELDCMEDELGRYLYLESRLSIEISLKIMYKMKP